MKNIFLTSGVAALGVLAAQLETPSGTLEPNPDASLRGVAPRKPNRHEARRLAKLEREMENGRR